MLVQQRNGVCRWLAAGAVAAGVMTPSLLAGPLDKKWVDAQARWLVHVDIEAALGSSYGPSLHALYEKAVAHADNKQAAAVLDQTGVDLIRDIKGATIYGMDTRGKEAVVLIHATESVERLLGVIAAEVPEFQHLPEHELPTFSWPEKDEVRYARSFPGPVEGERVIVLAPDLDWLARAEAHLTGEAPAAATLAGATDLAAPMLRSPRQGSMLFVAAHGLGSEGKGKGPSAYLSRLTSTLAIDIGESGADTYGDIVLSARKEREADAMVQTINGMVAIGQTTIHTEPGFEKYIGLLDGVKVEREEREVRTSIIVPTARLTETVSELVNFNWDCNIRGLGGGKDPSGKGEDAEGKPADQTGKP